MRPTARSGQSGSVFLQPSGQRTAAVTMFQHPRNALKFSAGEKRELGVTHLQLKWCHRQPPHLVEHSGQHLDLTITQWPDLTWPDLTRPDQWKIIYLIIGCWLEVPLPTVVLTPLVQSEYDRHLRVETERVSPHDKLHHLGSQQEELLVLQNLHCVLS